MASNLNPSGTNRTLLWAGGMLRAGFALRLRSVPPAFTPITRPTNQPTLSKSPMKRPSFLAHHMKTLNRSVSRERATASRKFWFLFPIACLSVGFGSGFILGHEKAYRGLTTLDPGYVHSEADKTRSSPTPYQGTGIGTQLEWRGSTRSGESIRENERQGLNFVF